LRKGDIGIDDGFASRVVALFKVLELAARRTIAARRISWGTISWGTAGSTGTA
jgi:hypothetical protein